MFSGYQVAIVCALGCLMLSSSGYAEHPGLGRALSETQVTALDMVIMPNGQGLPAGSGDAVTGIELYARHCLACHGADGKRGINDQLVGGHGSLGTPTPVKSVGSYWPYATTVFDFIRRAMPYNAPGSLSANEVYALTAYILFANKIISKDQKMDANSLPTVTMPNRINFRWSNEVRQLSEISPKDSN